MGFRLQNFNHYAFLIDKRGNVHKGEWNAACTPSSGKRGAARHTIHAEMHALAKLRDMDALAGCTLVVARFNAHGHMADSKPCAECHTKLTLMMSRYGLKGGTAHISLGLKCPQHEG